MTSMLYVREPGGLISVKQKSIMSDVISDSLNAKYFEPAGQGKVRPHTTPNLGRGANQNDTSHREAGMDPQALACHSLRLQEWLNGKSVKVLEERSNEESRPTKKLYNDVLATEETFVKGLTNEVKRMEYLEQRKKEILHKNWSERVYDPIRRAVIEQSDGKAYDELRKRKQELYKDYLQHTNKKGHVFLEVVHPEEYYPLALQPSRPSLVPGFQAAVSGPLNDPTLLQENKALHEEQTILRCVSGYNYPARTIKQVHMPYKLVPLGREDRDSRRWIAMEMGDIDSPQRYASRKRMVGLQGKSQIDLPAWHAAAYENIEGAAPPVDDEKAKISRRRQCPEPPLGPPPRSHFVSRRRQVDSDAAGFSKLLPIFDDGSSRDVVLPSPPPQLDFETLLPREGSASMERRIYKDALRPVQTPPSMAPIANLPVVM